MQREDTAVAALYPSEFCAISNLSQKRISNLIGLCLPTNRRAVCRISLAKSTITSTMTKKPSKFPWRTQFIWPVHCVRLKKVWPHSPLSMITSHLPLCATLASSISGFIRRATFQLSPSRERFRWHRTSTWTQWKRYNPIYFTRSVTVTPAMAVRKNAFWMRFIGRGNSSRAALSDIIRRRCSINLFW